MATYIKTKCHIPSCGNPIFCFIEDSDLDLTETIFLCKPHLREYQGKISLFEKENFLFPPQGKLFKTSSVIEVSSYWNPTEKYIQSGTNSSEKVIVTKNLMIFLWKKFFSQKNPDSCPVSMGEHFFEYSLKKDSDRFWYRKNGTPVCLIDRKGRKTFVGG